jgi:hypothetical protein
LKLESDIYKVGNFEYIKVIRDKETFKTYEIITYPKKFEKELPNIVPIYFENGIIIKSIASDELVFLFFDKEASYDTMVKEAFIINKAGLNTISSKDKIIRYLTLFKKKEEGYSYYTFKNKLVLINSNLNIVKSYKVIKERKLNYVSGGKIIAKYPVTGWISQDYSFYYFDPITGILYKNNKVYETGVKEIFLAKTFLNKEKINKWSILVIKSEDEFETINDFAKVYLLYFEYQNKKFRVQNNYLYKIDEDDNLIPFIKNGVIIAIFKNGLLKKVTFGMLNVSQNYLSAELLNDFKLKNVKIIDKNGKSYIVEDNYLVDLKTGKKIPLNKLKILGKVILNKDTLEKVLTIDKIQTLQKYNLTIETVKYSIVFEIINDKSFVKISEKDSNKIITEGELNNFFIFFKDKFIEIYQQLSSLIDKEKKLVNGKKYAYIKRKDGELIFLDSYGNEVERIRIKNNFRFILKDKILKVFLNKGKMFYLENSLDNLNKIFIKSNIKNIKGKIEITDKDKHNISGTKAGDVNFLSDYLKRIFGGKSNIKNLNIYVKEKFKDEAVGGFINNVLSLSELANIRVFNKITFFARNGIKINFIDANTVNLKGLDSSVTIKIKNAYFDLEKNIIKLMLVNVDSDVLAFLKKVKIELPANIKRIDSLTISVPYKYAKLDVVAFSVNKNKEEMYYYIEGSKVSDKIKDIYFARIRFTPVLKIESVEKVISNDIDLKNAKLILITKKGKHYIDLNKIVSQEDKESVSNYLSVIENHLTAKQKKEAETALPKLNEEEIKLDIKIKNLREKIKNLKKDLGEMTAKNNYVTLTADEEIIKQIQKENKTKNSEYFVFDLGAKLKYEIPNSIEIIEGKDSYTLGKLETITFTDIEGNQLVLNKAKLLLKVKGDFSTRKVYVYPVKIIFINKYGIKQAIDIPEDATTPLYKEVDDGIVYYSKGIPAYYVNRKLKNLGSLTILSAISSMLKATSEANNPTQALANALNPQEQIQQQTTTAVKQTVAGGVDELIQFVKENQSKLKDLLITDPNLKIESKFIKEVKITIKQNKEE